MRNLNQLNVYVTDEVKKRFRKRRGELGIEFDSVYLNMLITRDLKEKRKF